MNRLSVASMIDDAAAKGDRQWLNDRKAEDQAAISAAVQRIEEEKEFISEMDEEISYINNILKRMS